MDKDYCSTWLEIDLDAIRNNVRCLLDLSRRQVMAVVKANGYGHGLVPAARAAVSAGAGWCGVARLEEALVLRQAGLVCGILVMGYTPSARIPEAIANRISVTMYDPDVGTQYAQMASTALDRLNVHVKVETGMGRLGISAGQAPDFIHWLNRQAGLRVEGIFTHFACADEPGSGSTEKQIELFNAMLESWRAANGKELLIHASNSAGAINYPQAGYDMIRPGNAIYGLHPSPDTLLPAGFQPALTWKAHLVSIKTLPPQHGISYGSIYTTKGEEHIGVIPVGYADGYRRIDHQVVLLAGRRVPVVGRVCMDQCMLLLESNPGAQIGDEVVLLGRQGQDAISAEELAQRWGTNNYEVVCGLADRLPRLYMGE
jgi:alanine racemase